MRNIFLASLVGFLAFLADRICKIFFLNNPGVIREFFFVSFKFEKNYGMAFGISVSRIVLLFLICIVLLFLIRWLIDETMEKQTFGIFGLIFVIVGAFSNLLDRIKFGFVIDYIDVPFFTVLNIADIMISAGVILILLNSIKHKKIAV